MYYRTQGHNCTFIIVDTSSHSNIFFIRIFHVTNQLFTIQNTQHSNIGLLRTPISSDTHSRLWCKYTPHSKPLPLYGVHWQVEKSHLFCVPTRGAAAAGSIIRHCPVECGPRATCCVQTRNHANINALLSQPTRTRTYLSDELCVRVCVCAVCTANLFIGQLCARPSSIVRRAASSSPTAAQCGAMMTIIISTYCHSNS